MTEIPNNHYYNEQRLTSDTNRTKIENSSSYEIQLSRLEKGDIIRNEADSGYFLVQTIDSKLDGSIEVSGKTIAYDDGKFIEDSFNSTRSFYIETATLAIWQIAI